MFEQVLKLFSKFQIDHWYEFDCYFEFEREYILDWNEFRN